jgi:hypothetical protein
MFGYVCPVSSALDEAARTAFSASYCGVCRSMGIVARFTLSYECAFLAMLYDGLTSMPEISDRLCSAVPFRKKKMACGTNQQYAADINTLLSYYKFRDDVRDGGSLKARFLCAMLYPSKKAAAKRRVKAAGWIEDRLKELYRLEKLNCRDVDEPARIFAQLLQGVGAPGYDEEGALGRFFYDLGRWIYVIDALMDYQADQKAGRFNALAFHGSLEAARQATEFSLWHGLSRMETALFLLNPAEPALTVCKHILYDVLPGHTLRALGLQGGRKTESVSGTGR